MTTHIVHHSDKITLLGGATVDPAHLRRALEIAPALVAADGGADAALAAGCLPGAVIGDFDSISDAARAAIPDDRQYRVTEQDSTDFEKCLRHVAARLVLGLGFLGDRFDHGLAALNALVRNHERRCLLIGDDDICFHCPPDLALDLPEGMRFSLFPMRPVRGVSEGLHWPIDGLDFAPGGRIGTSNRVSGPVRLRMEAPGMAVILPVEALDMAVAALMPPVVVAASG
ncbi:thiamine diphosphokinase [Rhodovulum sulfidophilum]|uniref:thiamine diphosphokinase n=1 Tax=Rhodovulum sulfidophilum TaxID=35806 RepID=UPI0019247781|nr:thiamine diphosphokinase [Rhodovulum sulfidophilum]MBL3575041.1 thiamine diphosphokinase [Rhodovulum sulfidophilum]MCF4115962.1 thiamine diphosphokinase [Rhodovulum sulfidophilum]